MAATPGPGRTPGELSPAHSILRLARFRGVQDDGTVTRDELSFEMYVVLGNALHLLVNGVKPEDRQRLGLPMAELQRVHAWLEPLRANELADAVESLPEADRRMLAEAVALCERLADTQAEHLMGAPAEVRAEVLDALRSTTAKDEEPA